MVRSLQISKLHVRFVFRHKWDEESRSGVYSTMFRGYEIGIWYRRNKIVGRKNFKDPKKWGNNLVYSYMMGVDLIICKTWIEFDFGGMHLKIKK